MSRPLNVLFTSAGRRVELLREFRRALDVLGRGGRVIALDVDPLAPALRVADSAHVVPHLSSEEYLPALMEICRREEVALVFPLIDPDIPVLARHRDVIQSTGPTVVVVDAAAAATAEDKWSTFNWFTRIGVPTPATWLPEALPAEPPYPVFVKPRRGSASTNCFVARNEKELRFFSEYVPDPVVQEWLPGPEVTTDVTCDMTGDVLGVVSRQRIQTRSGEMAKGVTVYHPEIVDGCLRIALSLCAVGPITIQGLWSNGCFRFTEVNARFGGGVLLGIAAGADAPLWLLARAAGIPFETPPLGGYQTNLMLSRFDESFVFWVTADGTFQSHRL